MAMELLIIRGFTRFPSATLPVKVSLKSQTVFSADSGTEKEPSAPIQPLVWRNNSLCSGATVALSRAAENWRLASSSRERRVVFKMDEPLSAAVNGYSFTAQGSECCRRLAGRIETALPARRRQHFKLPSRRGIAC